MSFMERMMADLTGMTTYSKDELIEMGLVYKDFNKVDFRKDSNVFSNYTIQ